MGFRNQILTTLLILFTTLTGQGQDLYSKCLSPCSPPGIHRNVLNHCIINPSGEIIQSGADYGINYISKSSSMDSLLWSKKIINPPVDTIFGQTDSVIHINWQINRLVNFNDNSLIFTIQQDCTIYHLFNNTQVFDRSGLKSAILNKIDLNGNLQWSKFVEFDRYNILNHISATLNKVLYSGSSSQNYFQNGQLGDQFLVCTDTAGVLLWSKYFTNSQTRKINKTVNYFQDGFLVLSQDLSNIYLMRLDFDGNLEWSNKYSGGFNSIKSDIIVSPDSSIYMLARVDSGIYRTCLLKVDPLGNLVWSNIYGIDTIQRPKQFLEVTGDSVKVLIEDVKTGTSNVYNLETDNNGNIINTDVVFQNEGATSPVPLSYTIQYLYSVDKQGNYFIGNVSREIVLTYMSLFFLFEETMRFDRYMGSCTFNKYSTTIFSQSYNCTQLPFAVTDSIISVNLLSNVVNLTNETYNNVLSCVGSVGIAEQNSADSEIEIFPNPTSTTLTIKWNVDPGFETLELFDVRGRIVYKFNGKIGSNFFQLELPPNIESGIYNLRITQDGNSINKRVVILKN